MTRLCQQPGLLLPLLLLVHVTVCHAYPRVLVVFGNSLADPGNVFAQTGGKSPDPKYYYQGRFSNGKVAVEYAAEHLHVPAYNYAFGGGKACPGGGSQTPLSKQIDLYLNKQAPPAQAGWGVPPISWGTLALVDIGSNDFIEALFEAVGCAAPSTCTQGYPLTGFAEKVFDCVKQGVWRLVTCGVPKIVVVNSPDLTDIPLSNQLKQWFPTQVSDLGREVQKYNHLLLDFVIDLKKQGHYVKLFDLYDASKLFVAVAEHPLLGFKHTGEEPCLNITITQTSARLATVLLRRDTGNVPPIVSLLEFVKPSSQCSNPDEYVYYDQVHPTTKAHKLIGTTIAAFLAAT